MSRSRGEVTQSVTNSTDRLRECVKNPKKGCVTSFMDGPLPFLPRLAGKILATSDPLFCRLSCKIHIWLTMADARIELFYQ